MKKIKTHIHAKTIPENHISHKKKNTYTICFSSLMPLHAFQLCRETPLAVIKKNGQQTQEITDWLTCTMFPNPTANEMGTVYRGSKHIIGEKIATTIIEYLDKDTGEPVCQLYPHTLHIFDGYKKTYMQHLNHASRRDLQHQLKIRKQLLRKVYSNQK
ncbi:MAG: hypothetical protein IJY99_03375 [Alphaproteobacteria bacterium]|nr:hypothetical protein [Alphaproteobacteria bacterium]